MIKVHGKLCSLINKLKAICKTLASIRKDLEVVIPLVPVDVYYKFLLASAGIRTGIEISGGMIKKTKMSLQRQKMPFIDSEERTR